MSCKRTNDYHVKHGSLTAWCQNPRRRNNWAFLFPLTVMGVQKKQLIEQQIEWALEKPASGRSQAAERRGKRGMNCVVM